MGLPTALNASNLVESNPGEDLMLLVALLSAKEMIICPGSVGL